MKMAFMKHEKNVMTSNNSTWEIQVPIIILQDFKHDTVLLF